MLVKVGSFIIAHMVSYYLKQFNDLVAFHLSIDVASAGTTVPHISALAKALL